MNIARSPQKATRANVGQKIQDQQLILLTGLALGVTADLLVWSQGPAVFGFFVWVVLVASSICCLTRLKETANLPHVLIWSAVACTAAFMLVLRSTPILIPAMWLVMLTAAALICGKYFQPRLLRWRVTDLIHSVMLTGLYTGFGVLPLLSKLRIIGITDNPRNAALFRSLLILIPLLLIFLLLFASADIQVNRLTDELLSWFSEDLVSHLFRIALFSWVSAGLLRVMSHSNTRSLPLPQIRAKLGTLEITVVLGGLSLLFVAFVLLQLGYLFGGSATIQSTTGLTIAEYARRGFFELLAVAGLTLSLLLGLYPLSSDKSRFRLLAVILILCVLIMQISAAQRLGYYIAEFGLSLDRVIASTVMIWLACVLLAFGGTVLRGDARGFVVGSVIAGVVAVFTCSLINPAALVGRVNIERSVIHGDALDVEYLLQLGPDIVPTLLNQFDQLPAPAQCVTAMYLLEENPSLEAEDWRRFKISAWRANKDVIEHGDQLNGAIASIFGNAQASFREAEDDRASLLASCNTAGG